jgi:exopolyphosphatase/pppGpp-phosphohydrolase
MTFATSGSIEMRPSVMVPFACRHRSLAAIRIGIDEVALKIVRPIVTGGTEVIHLERATLGYDGAQDDTHGLAPADRLIAVLRRFDRTCRGYAAIPRVVAGSAFCALPGTADLIARARREAEVEIEALSSRQEAQLLCQGVLMGRPPSERGLLVTTDGASVSLVFAAGDQPVALWTLGLDRIRGREMAMVTADAADGPDETEVRREAHRMVSAARLGVIPATVGHVILVADAARLAWSSDPQARTRELNRTLFRGLILEALVDQLGLAGVKVSRASLLDGVLVDLVGAQSREARWPS